MDPNDFSVKIIDPPKHTQITFPEGFLDPWLNDVAS